MNPSFKQMMNEVVAYGSCCECGSCVLVCPHNVIDYIDGKPKQVAKATAAFDHCGISEGIGCDVCAQVCPRLGDREHHLTERVFADELAAQDTYWGAFGAYRRIVAARSKDPEVLARCEDGGVVTTLLAWLRRNERIDGAIVSAVDKDKPCQPVPKVVTSVEDIIASASSWYTYCPNNLALADAEKLGLTKVAFVGVPCQITPVRKMQATDESYLNNGRKKDKHIERQTKFLKGYGARVAFNIGLLCSEVFSFDGLMIDTIQNQMGIALSDIRQFNVKGKVQIFKHDGTLVEMNLRKSQEYARPECHHCADFSAELADISCGGVGASNWTITIIRSRTGEEVFDAAVRDGVLDVQPIEQFENSMKVLLRLNRKQRERVPTPPGRAETFVRPDGFRNPH
ncbi:MAG: Coenzyme F420 hydrogenase/dehydrogenase, beta subunit C-terminal domain [Deltaproteobacteria bacterium]|nr:Coenzyme F420 hydrogenase/dehydrogenase, beta subunit C-terminal domain [Deltaproteobacteria bacterium]MBI3389098.1 Coenzyme F420 hydrogenase/dehydrogenase, beta subunit C-terminal domain [Deltaproteobacteria bacterium]